EICDAIIDQLQGDKRSLLRASLTCRALYPRTGVHLFSRVVLSTESSCIRLAKLTSLSPKFALLFKSLGISAARIGPIDYRPFTVIESLVNLKHLTLSAYTRLSTLEQWASFWFKGNFTEECHLDHSLHRIPAPVALHIGEADPTFPIETLLKLAHLNQYLVLVGTSLNLLHVNHSVPVPIHLFRDARCL
ncbi:hypothetical protein EV421DRAFT_2024655, partial [Armillaria borealis]